MANRLPMAVHPNRKLFLALNIQTTRIKKGKMKTDAVLKDETVWLCLE